MAGHHPNVVPLPLPAAPLPCLAYKRRARASYPAPLSSLVLAVAPRSLIAAARALLGAIAIDPPRRCFPVDSNRIRSFAVR